MKRLTSQRTSTALFFVRYTILYRKYRHTRGTHVQSGTLKQTGATLTSPKPSKEQPHHLVIDKNEGGSRLDRVLIRQLGAEKRTLIMRLIRKGNVRLNGKRVKPETRVHTGDHIFLPLSLRQSQGSSSHQKAQQHAPLHNLTTLYEDHDLLVLDKPAGLVVHSGSRHDSGLIERLKIQRNLPELRLAHRLDRDTSGCLLLAKNLHSLRKLTDSFRKHHIHKTYWAWVSGHPYPYAGRMQSKLLKGITQGGERMVVSADEGQEAVTDLQTILLQKYNDWAYSLVALQPHSGRTHQLRVQLQQEGHAILGDPKYASKEELKAYKDIHGKGLALHAWRLRLRHPVTNKQLEFRAPWPKRWAHFSI